MSEAMFAHPMYMTTVAEGRINRHLGIVSRDICDQVLDIIYDALDEDNDGDETEGVSEIE